MYETPYDRFGMLSYQMWRAARLVVDTGIHAKGWTREQAQAYLHDNTALSDHEIETEVDRYISWPGQALSYYLGEMAILRARAKAEARWAPKFDIRAFHDTVLELGSVPLPVLDRRIDRFIAEGGKGPYPGRGEIEDPAPRRAGRSRQARTLRAERRVDRRLRLGEPGGARVGDVEMVLQPDAEAARARRSSARWRSTCPAPAGSCRRAPDRALRGSTGRCRGRCGAAGRAGDSPGRSPRASSTARAAASIASQGTPGSHRGEGGGLGALSRAPRSRGARAPTRRRRRRCG